MILLKWAYNPESDRWESEYKYGVILVAANGKVSVPYLGLINLSISEAVNELDNYFSRIQLIMNKKG